MENAFDILESMNDGERTFSRFLIIGIEKNEKMNLSIYDQVKERYVWRFGVNGSLVKHMESFNDQFKMVTSETLQHAAWDATVTILRESFNNSIIQLDYDCKRCQIQMRVFIPDFGCSYSYYPMSKENLINMLNRGIVGTIDPEFAELREKLYR